MPNKIFATISITIFLLSNIIVKTAQDPIPLYQSSQNIKTLVAHQNAENFDAWKNFTNKYGNWNATIDQATGTPAIAFGKPIKIVDAANLNENLILAATKMFLNENKNIFKVNTNELKLKRIEQVQNKWYVTFGQVYENYDVMFSEVQFTINQKGEVFAFKITFYNNIELPTTPQISINDLLTAVNNSFNENPSFDKKETNTFQSGVENIQYIIPIYKNNSVSYHLASQINTNNNQGRRLYESYVDVYSGEILWQKSCLLDYEAKIKMKVKTFDKYNFEPEKEFPVSHGKILVNGKSKTLDENGEIVLTEPADEIAFYFESDLTKIKYSEGGNVNFDDPETVTFSISEGENELLLDESNSNQYERFAIHHINIAKQKILEVDPSLKCMDKKLPITFYKYYIVYGPNAHYSPGEEEFGFTYYLQDTILMATCPAVMYHEYGHAINDLFYKERGTVFTNRACHEALADANANMILDDSIGTQKIFANDPDNYIRNSDNNNIYPDSNMGGGVLTSHFDGLILAGAFWDLRKLTSVETAYRLSHFARYELPDDIDNGTAFHEWFMAVLIADDDDGDLTNGTPNFDAIVTAFNNHNIGLNIFVSRNLEFIPPKDIYENPQIPQKFEVTINNVSSFILPVKLPDSMIIVYSTDCFKTSDTTTLYKNDNKYEGEVHGFDKPQMVRYYLEYVDANSNHTSKIEQSNNRIFDFVYHTGYYTIWKEDFENNPQYSIETKFYANGDQGEGWEISSLHINKRPNFQITEGGNKCLVTGSGIPTSAKLFPSGSLNNGNSTAISPEYTIPKVNGKLYIGCWIYENANFGFFANPLPLADTTNGFHFLYKTNKMNNWEALHISVIDYYNGIPTEGEGYYRFMQNNWKKCLFKLPDAVLDANQITFKFYAGSRQKYSNSTTSFSVNVLVDDIELLTDAEYNSVEEPSTITNLQISPNPTNNTSTLTLGLETAGCLIIALNNILGQELFELYNAFTDATTFTKTFSIAELPIGVYYLKITHNGNVKVEKVIRK